MFADVRALGFCCASLLQLPTISSNTPSNDLTSKVCRPNAVIRPAYSSELSSLMPIGLPKALSQEGRESPLGHFVCIYSKLSITSVEQSNDSFPRGG
jgi:hypothetical protein